MDTNIVWNLNEINFKRDKFENRMKLSILTFLTKYLKYSVKYGSKYNYLIKTKTLTYHTFTNSWEVSRKNNSFMYEKTRVMLIYKEGMVFRCMTKKINDEGMVFTI